VTWSSGTLSAKGVVPARFVTHLDPDDERLLRVLLDRVKAEGPGFGETYPPSFRIST